jgi:radical SAM superfamily enzyme YgiQ (UPF0313 family)
MSKQPKKSISVLNIDLRVPVQRLPIIWLSFKNYYTKFGKYSDQVEWKEPILDFENLHYDDIVDYYDKQDSDVYAFSTYLWSHKAIMAIAEEIKKRNPKRIVVLGGPYLDITYKNNIEWFFKNKFIDAICEPTSYGEWFMTDLINQVVEGEKIDWSKVAFAIHRTGRGYFPNKLDFEFPGPLIEGNEDIFYKCKDIALERNIPFALSLETTRGCPYQCVFCEWGGGVGGKVVRRPMEQILADLDAIPHIGIDQIQILDANWGIFKEDAQVSQYIADLKTNFGLPNHVEIYGMTKSSPERRWGIIEPLAKAGVVDRYKLSMQSISEDVLKRIKRKDVPREKDFEFAKYLSETYGIRADIEFIMGLPGTTRELFYEELDLQFDYGYDLERYIWMFLPDSPGYSPDYVKEQGIKTVKTCVGKSRLNSYAFDDAAMFDSYHISADERFLSDIEFVVETNTYSREDFALFFFFSYWLLNTSGVGINENILKMNIENGKLDKPSTVFKRVFDEFMTSDNLYASAMRNLYEQMLSFVKGEREDITDFRQFNLPWTDTSTDMMYIYKAALIVFNEEFIELFKKIFSDLNMDLPEEYLTNLRSNVASMRLTDSPKFDKFYQVRTFYEEQLREKRIIAG